GSHDNALCLLIAWAGPQESLQKVLKRKNLRLFDLSRNWLLFLPLLGSLLLSAEVMLTLLQDALGLPSGSITITNRLEFLLDLSYAAVIEEVGFRLSPLGATTAVLVALEAPLSPKPEGRMPRGLDLLFLAFLYPDGAKKKASLKNVAEDGWLRGIHIIEFLVSLYSAIAFGMAHYIFGAGWGIGKVTTSSIVGFALALVYLRYGIEASILIHWYFNYYLYVFEIAPEFYPFLNPLATIIGALILFFGVAILVGLGSLLGKKFLRKIP
ncbi:CPBP family intramembrane metalloprotease, partial [Candidatus Bathyarchaeota archaeon]|nr:CPBP family intramembrane metalloprotease [Candidatus Bathyarchaeota archaeon]